MSEILDHPQTSRRSAVTRLPAPIVISVRKLQKSYDSSRIVLSDVSFDIRKGEKVALIGANGCGKSTLLRSIVGNHPISSGEVSMLGETFRTSPSADQQARLRARLGFVFQKHCLVRRSSVLSNVVQGMSGLPGGWRAIHQSLAPREWRERAIQALAEVKLESFATSRADALSGGQQQRVSIARALIRRPELIIADEPAASLDPVSGDDVMRLFARLADEQGITVLFTSHDMQQMLTYADRVIALRKGVVLFDKPARTVSEADLDETFRNTDGPLARYLN